MYDKRLLHARRYFQNVRDDINVISTHKNNFIAVFKTFEKTCGFGAAQTLALFSQTVASVLSERLRDCLAKQSAILIHTSTDDVEGYSA